MKQITEISISLKKTLTSFAFILLFFAIEVWTQMPQVVISDNADSEPAAAAAVAAEDNTWWYILLILLGIGLAGAIYWMKISKVQRKEQEIEEKKKATERKADPEAVDFDKELEWFRKNRKSMNTQSSANGKLPDNFPKTSRIAKPKKTNGSAAANKTQLEEKSPQAENLPVFSIERLEFARPFDQLPLSNDPSLMSAVEQTQDEFEEDEGFRELSVKVLAAFKTRNAVEALSQVALYDLSSFLRSKAVAVLADFNHESVFETILLACADPTREVRAAAARGLFQVTFDRSDAWTRIAETQDDFRIKQAARAALEADLSERLFDRLVHKDVKSAYEAFAFVGLLLKSGETESVFEAMQSHKDMNVRKAILHVIEVTKEPNALEGLYSILENDKLPPEMLEKADRLVEEIGMAVI